jgi:PAS domain-containing protein
MRLEKFLNEGSKSIIYLDMDGVLTDFEAAFVKIDGRPETEIEKQGDPAFWAHVKQGGLEFWSKMPWMKDGKQLWQYVRKHNVEILSAPARALPESNKGKEIWVRRELGNIKMTLIRANQKQKFASPTAILIDDNKKNIDRWNAAGGVGIWHVSANKTIKQLKDLSIES